MILQSTDQLGYLPSRIISLVPSQTELLYDLQLESVTVGITKFCIHPQEWFRTKTRVGGTKQVKRAVIDSLGPDLIIANKEENVKEQVEDLAKDYPVWVSDIHTLADALGMIADIGRLTGSSAQAMTLIQEIQEEFDKLRPVTASLPYRFKTVYLIWRKPYMTIGQNTFIHDMLQHCGLDNIFTDMPRYPEILIEDLKASGCELLLLSSEPYPFQQKHIDELQDQLPQTRIVLADGEMFSWYGSRLRHAPAYFKDLLGRIISEL